MVLDKRILQLENELEITGQRIRSEPAAYAAATVAQRGIDRINPNVVAPVAGSFILFVMFPIALAFSRRIWRRGVAPAAAASRESPESTQRLTRLEEAIDAIAVEVERISEGQRFMTKIMVGQRGTGSPAEAASASRALGAGEAPAEPIRVADKEAARVK